MMKLDWQKQLRYLKRETYTLYFACGDLHTPWYAEFLAICVVTYAFSPIDLIPDFIPVSRAIFSGRGKEICQHKKVWRSQTAN